MNYPKHLEEKIRQEVAREYIKHEIKKLFIGLPKDYFSKIDKEIEGWAYSNELSWPRDFWNGFHGIAMGFKLKIGLIYLVTAENIVWRKKILNADELYFGVSNSATDTVGNEERSAKAMKEFFENNSKQRKIELAKTKIYRKGGENREEDPIIVVERDDRLSIYDGNGRFTKKILEGKYQIDAFVGSYKSQEKFPKNYWLPTSLLMDNLYYLYEAIKNKDEILIDAYIKILKDMISHSESGKYEFWERALTSKNELRMIIEARMK